VLLLLLLTVSMCFHGTRPSPDEFLPAVLALKLYNEKKKTNSACLSVMADSFCIMFTALPSGLPISVRILSP